MPYGPVRVTVPLDADVLAQKDGIPVPGSRGLVLRGELRTTDMDGLDPGTRVLSLFLVNDRGELFSALVLDDAGRPLGPVAQAVRTTEGCLSSESTAPVPFVDHDEQAERAIRAADFHLPGRDLVDVMDREFDELTLERWLGDTSKKYVIRANHLDRRVLLGGRPTPLWHAVRAARRRPDP